jgi:transposase
MYLRKLTRHKDGKTHAYWALVESYRTARGPRQRVVTYLGELNENTQHHGADVVPSEAPEPSTSATPLKPLWREIDVRGVRTENSRAFGAVWLGLELLKRLGLLEFLREKLPRGKEELSWAEIATILVLARFTSPSSELYIAEHLYAQTALPDLLGIPAEKVNDDRLYRALDKLLPHKEALEKFLKERMGSLFELQYDLIFYDLTSTYFEGQARKNAQAKRGYSRDKRPDCKQVCIALVVTRDGIPLGYEVFEGNTRDVTTLKEILEKMESRYGQASRIWIVDRGMVSQENMKLLAQSPRQYIVGTPRSMLKKFEPQLLSKAWKSIRDDLEVQYCTSPEYGEEIFVLCRSADRKTKEHAITERSRQRVEDGLAKLQKNCDQGKLIKASVVERKIGRLLARNSRVARWYQIEVQKTDDHKLHLHWTKDTAQQTRAEQTEGCYLLRSNVKNWSEEELWSAYVQLSHAEAAFRIQKSDLKLRPVWHQKKERVQAHLLVCFLAYVLWKTLGQICKSKGLGNEPRKVLDDIGRIQVCDVILPTKAGAEIKLRCVTKPDTHQNILLHHLGLQLPARLNQERNL